MKSERRRTPIQILDETTINQIAAGEVIENPSSVIKELMDNAIDAGASSIEVETKGGGLHFIRVSDNGWGMTKEEALVAMERHATSKIQTADDLFKVSTLGFRGEALPSIASISRFTLLTKPQDDPMGTLLVMEGGKRVDCRAAQRQRGTTVEVKNLFFNVPVRKKFQRSASSETAEISKFLNKMALCYPEISFTWIHDEKKVLEVPEADLKGRMGAIWGEELASQFLPISFEASEWQLEGYISKPEFSRTHRLGQYFFINKRPLLCPFFSDAVREGYSTRLSEGSYPLCVLFLELPSHGIDINVHPQKKEARFFEEKILGEWISTTISQAIQKEEKQRWSAPPSKMVWEEKEVVSEEKVPYVASYVENVEKQEEWDHSIKFLAFQGRYALIQNQEGIVLMDPEALLQALFFHETKENASSSQVLLFPMTHRINKEERQVIESFLPLFDQWGLHIRLLGSDTVAIDAIPTLLPEGEVIAFLEGILSKGKQFHEDLLIETKMALAKRIKKTKWSAEELVVLYKRLERHPEPPLMWNGGKTLCLLNNDHFKDCLKK